MHNPEKENKFQSRQTILSQEDKPQKNSWLIFWFIVTLIISVS